MGPRDLYHYKARAYAPRLSRFLQPDPTGYNGGPNLYAYVQGDPLNHTDPTGLVVFPNGPGSYGWACQEDPQCVANDVTPLSEVTVTAQRNRGSVSWDPSSRVFYAFEAAMGSMPPARGNGAARQQACRAGQSAGGVATAAGAGAIAHGGMADLAERAAGQVARRAFAPLAYALEGTAAAATFTASQQRGEPLDVSIERTALPFLFGLAGSTGAGAVSGAVGGALGGPLGFATGAAGFVAGGIVGERAGSNLAEAYARARGFGGCN